MLACNMERAHECSIPPSPAWHLPTLLSSPPVTRADGDIDLRHFKLELRSRLLTDGKDLLDNICIIPSLVPMTFGQALLQQIQPLAPRAAQSL